MWLQDVRLGLRGLLKAPSFTAAAVLILSLGIGANTAMFSTVSAVILHKMPFDHPERLVTLWETNTRKGVDQSTVSAQTFADWRDGSSRAFERMALYGTDNVVLTGAGEPERVASAQVSADFFSLLGARAGLGRTFLPEDGRPGAGPMALLGDGIWRRRFGSDPSIIGRAIVLNNTSYTVVGVLPPDFRFIDQADIWSLLPPDDPRQSCDACHFFTVIARLRDGVTPGQAQAEMDALSRQLAGEHPERDAGVGVKVIGLQDYLVANVRSSLLIISGAVIFVLLIACANVANLLLARTAARRKEFATRAALGATRLHLVRQMLIESILLSLLGGGFGLLLAMWGVGIVNGLLPAGIVPERITLDLAVLGFTFLLSLLTGCLFGLAPAAQVSRTDLEPALRQSMRGSTGTARHARTRGLLIVFETALSLTLLVGAGLMIKSFLVLQRVNPGFNPDNVLTARVFLASESYPKAQQKAAFFQTVLRQLETLPGVESVGAATALPLSGASMNFRFIVEGQPSEAPGGLRQAQYRAVSPNYFRAMGIPLLKGRDFTEQDGPAAGGVVIINETMARHIFPGQEALGKRLIINYGDAAPREVVAVVGDVKHLRLDEGPKPEMYVPYLQNPWPFMTFVIRTSVPPDSIIPSVRQRVWGVDKDQPVDKVLTMSQILDESVAKPRLYVLLMSVFAAIAVALAATGIYGVMSYLVSQRTNEIGIRMALGARPSSILGLVVWQGMSHVLVGSGIGLVISLVLIRVFSSLLYGISDADSRTFVEAPLLLIAVALTACCVPAYRATKIEPITALRYD